MSAEQPSVKTEVCANFEPQAWRKTLCVNCFHTKDEHGAGGTSTDPKDKSGPKPTTIDNKSSPKSSITSNTPDLPTPKPAANKPLGQHATGKSSPVPKIKNGDSSGVKGIPEIDRKSTKLVDTKKNPPSVSPKQTPDPPGKKAMPLTKQQTPGLADDGSGSKFPTATPKTTGKVPPGPTDVLRKHNGIDTKIKTATPGVNKSELSSDSSRSSPLLSSKSQKSTTDEQKTPDKQLDKSKSSRFVKPQEDTTAKGKPPSKVLGLLKSFKTDDSTPANDVRVSVKDNNARSEKNETKSVPDVSKLHASKDSRITGKGFSSDHKSSSDGNKSSTTTPPSTRAQVPADSTKVKHGDVTSRNRQSVNDGEKETSKSSNRVDSLTAKDKDFVDSSSSKGKTFNPVSFSSASKGDKEASNVTSPTSKLAESAKSAELAKSEELLKLKELELKKLANKLKEMEEKCKQLSDDNVALKKMAAESKKEELEKNLSTCRSQLNTIEAKFSKLQSDNQELQNKMKIKEAQIMKESTSNKEISQMERDLENSDVECQELKIENLDLRKELSSIKIEMEEMYDTFKENEMDEFRELQKELDLTSKNCRILQFKLRKSERRNEQIESDKQSYEDKLRSLQSQFTADDAREHIRSLEEDLKMAKEVSVRLHDEIDLVEDKKAKVEDENRQLTEILEQADKKQFRMEMDIDRLKDQIADLKQKLPRSETDQDSRDRRTY